ncbi:MAG TPA: hypothetical protein VFO58_25445 [Vicinamibacterales bacterium]|nr:hypothetical protein [Vicinamibacterales bacterium]
MTNTEQRRLTNWRLKLLQAAGDAGNVAGTMDGPGTKDQERRTRDQPPLVCISR